MSLDNIPLVSIGIINYNGMRFLRNCIDAYLKQSYPNIEIIIIDDCSSDGSIEYLKSLEKENERIRCIYHSINSGGPSLAIQELIDEARGKYFQWLACDDYPEPKAIEKLVKLLEETDNDYAYCNFSVIDDKNNTIAHWGYRLPTIEEMVYHVFTYCSGIIPMNGLYRRDFFLKNNISWLIYRNNDHSSDTINSLYFIMQGMTYCMLKESLINYRIHSSNESQNIAQRLRTSLSVYDFIIQNFDEAVYLPDINWQQENREEMKSYILAQFYYNKIMDYLNLKGLPSHLRQSIPKEQIINYLEGFVKEGISYIHRGLGQGNSFREQLLELEEAYKKL